MPDHPAVTDPPADPPVDPPKADPPADPPKADPPAGDPPEPLGDAGKAALDAERKARRKAEKDLADAQKREKERADAELSENERLKKENEESRVKVEAATVKARNANLLTRLADEGLTGGKAKAAIRLLDNVEYDDQDEPTNLEEALTAAKAAYGEQTFTPDTAPKPKAPGLNGGEGNQPGPTPTLDAEELAVAEEAGVTPDRYEAMKDVHTYADFQAAQERLAAAKK